MLTVLINWRGFRREPMKKFSKGNLKKKAEFLEIQNLKKKLWMKFSEKNKMTREFLKITREIFLSSMHF